MRVFRGQTIWGAIVVLTLALALPFGAPSNAVPIPTPPPRTRETPTDSPPPGNTAANVLPYDSSVMIVLDDPIGSAISQRNQVKRAHLKDALVVDGRTLAPAGAPVSVDIVGAQGAQQEDVYGYVDIAIEPLVLTDGSRLPLRAPYSHLTQHTTAGHEATVGVEDTIGDIFIPGHIIYRALRRGRNVTIPAGSFVRTRTLGAVSINADGEVAVATPAPVSMPSMAPAADFKPLPFATAVILRPNQRATPYHATPEPTDTPTPEPTAPPTASPLASPSAHASTQP
jgi:hypothetical protein